MAELDRLGAKRIKHRRQQAGVALNMRLPNRNSNQIVKESSIAIVRRPATAIASQSRSARCMSDSASSERPIRSARGRRGITSPKATPRYSGK